MTDPTPAPAAPTPPPAGAPVAPPAGADYPGKMLGIVGLVLAFFVSLAGLIVSAIALNQSKAAGYTNTPAKIGLILSIVFLVLSILVGIIYAVVIGAAVSSGISVN